MLCLLAGCASDQAKTQGAGSPTPENNLCRTVILPITPKREDKDACLLAAHQVALAASQEIPDSVFAMLGPAVIFALPAAVAHMNSDCEEQMKTCLEQKGYKHPAKLSDLQRFPGPSTPQALECVQDGLPGNPQPLSAMWASSKVRILSTVRSDTPAQCFSWTSSSLKAGKRSLGSGTFQHSAIDQHLHGHPRVAFDLGEVLRCFPLGHSTDVQHRTG